MGRRALKTEHVHIIIMTGLQINAFQWHGQVILTSCVIFFCHGLASGEVGDIATIQLYDGQILGPYIVKEIHSDQDDGGDTVALPQTADEEGSGNNVLPFDDTEAGDDAIDTPFPWDPLNSDILPINIEPFVDDNGEVKTSSHEPQVPGFIQSSATDFTAIAVAKATAVAPTNGNSQSTNGNIVTEATTEAMDTGDKTEAATTDPACHEACVNMLHNSFAMEVHPNVSLLATGETLEMKCHVAQSLDGNMENVQLMWLYEGTSSTG